MGQEKSPKNAPTKKKRKKEKEKKENNRGFFVFEKILSIRVNIFYLNRNI